MKIVDVFFRLGAPASGTLLRAVARTPSSRRTGYEQLCMHGKRGRRLTKGGEMHSRNPICKHCLRAVYHSPLCVKAASNLDLLALHLPNRFACVGCGVSFSCNAHLTRHNVQKHSDSPRSQPKQAVLRTYGCGRCGEYFRKRIYLDHHRMECSLRCPSS